MKLEHLHKCSVVWVDGRMADTAASRAQRITTNEDLARIAADGAGFVIDPFNRRWHAASCPRVLHLTIGEPKWFAADDQVVRQFEEQRAASYPTAKRLQQCSQCAGAMRGAPKPTARSVAAPALPRDGSDFDVTTTATGFALSTAHRVPYPPKPNSPASRVRAELRARILQMRPGEGETLHAVITGEIPRNSDIENQLLYNIIGAAPALKCGVRFERGLGGRAGHFEYRYEIAPARAPFTFWEEGQTAAAWPAVSLCAGPAERWCSRVWWSMRDAAVTQSTVLPAQATFGVRLEVVAPRGTATSGLAPDRLKNVIDGVVAAFQRHEGPTDAFRRIAADIGCSAKAVAAAAGDDVRAVLGDAEPIRLTTANVQWNPDDTRLAAAEVTVAQGDVSSLQIAGSTFAVSPIQ